MGKRTIFQSNLPIFDAFFEDKFLKTFLFIVELLIWFDEARMGRKGADTTGDLDNADFWEVITYYSHLPKHSHLSYLLALPQFPAKRRKKDFLRSDLFSDWVYNDIYGMQNSDADNVVKVSSLTYFFILKFDFHPILILLSNSVCKVRINDCRK